jgi:hypothetical protein
MEGAERLPRETTTFILVFALWWLVVVLVFAYILL